MYRINAMIPLSNDSKRLPDDVYRAVERTNPFPQIGVFKETKRGRGTKLQFISLGDVKAAVRGPAIILSTCIEELPREYPYIRITFAFDKDSNVNIDSVNFVFSKDAGNLPEPNYTYVEE